MRSHCRRARHKTPSPHRRVKPLPAHVRDYASPHWRTPQILRGYCRHAQFMSELATCRAMPLLGRQAIVGLRDPLRAPSSTREAIIGSRPNARRHYQHGSRYRRPQSNNAELWSARDATIGTREKRRARGSRRFTGHPRGLAGVDAAATIIGPAARPPQDGRRTLTGPEGFAHVYQRPA